MIPFGLFCNRYLIIKRLGFPGTSVVENPPVKEGDAPLIPGLGRAPGEGNGPLMIKNLPANAGDVEMDSIPGSGRSPGEGNATHSSILAWRIPWTEEPGRL